MNSFARIALVVMSLTATAAAASQGDEITGLGYGKTMQHAKINTVKAWKHGAHDVYGYVSWGEARIGRMECFKEQQDYSANRFSTLDDTREHFYERGNDRDPWTCIVSGTQYVRY